MAALPWFALGGFSGVLAIAGNIWLLPIVALAVMGAIQAICCQGVLTGRRCVTGLTMRDDQLLARHRDGSVVAVSPGSGSRIGARFSVLQLRRTQNNRYHATMLLLSTACGNVSADDARRLRLWLRLGQKPASDSRSL